ncbi:hypothetical protein [Cryobacterium sp. PH29-G1]|uniref:hypothetical protein n=1 Tax=Cryobacterium sp. PH29-G1 TaxID=3046211 RepID=UPI0024BB0013|nr:hypothetical protein [Cryobacterium sp. PH29-G1]MDJ0347942.1 hypothetical protein [Cryobacterium sp. PH29-G1]
MTPHKFPPIPLPIPIPHLPPDVRRRIPKEMILAGAFFMIAMALGGVAYSLWSTWGDGMGTASTGTTLPIALAPATTTALLVPGGTAAVTLSASNPNTFAVRIGSISLDTTRGTQAIVADSAHSACATSALSFTVQTNTGTGWTVPAKSAATPGTVTISLANALAMRADAASACQGATFTVYLVTGS